MKSKKGAIELSMSTIIVIIIGVTLLSLGLMWVRGLMGKTTSLTSGAFDQADAAIGDIFQDVDSVLVISPPQMTISPGEVKIAKVFITNDAPTDTTFVAEIKNLDPENIDCIFTDSGEGISNTYNLPSGKQADFGIAAQVKGANAGKGNLLICNVVVTGIAGDNSAQLAVIVGGEKGLF